MTGSFFKGVQDDSTILTTLQIGYGTSAALGSALVGFAKITQSITPTSVSANTTTEQSVTVPGVQLGDYVEVCPPALTNGVVLANSRVSAANTVQFQWANNTSGALTPPSGNYIILVVR